MMRRWILPGGLLAAMSSIAWASSYRGADWGLLFLFYTLPFALIPVGLSLLLAAFKAFRNRAVYLLFVFAICAVAVFFLLLALNAPGGAASSLIAIIEIVVVAALALAAPVIQHRAARDAGQSPASPEEGQ